MTPGPTLSPMVSVEVPVDYWYETPIGWVIVGILIVVGVAVGAGLVLLAWRRANG